MGYIISVTDFITILSLLIFLIHVQRAVKLESERHRDVMLETKEFAVFIKKLPKLTQDFTIDMLKSDLWTKITEVIQKED